VFDINVCFSNASPRKRFCKRHLGFVLRAVIVRKHVVSLHCDETIASRHAKRNSAPCSEQCLRLHRVSEFSKAKGM